MLYRHARGLPEVYRRIQGRSPPLPAASRLVQDGPQTKAKKRRKPIPNQTEEYCKYLYYGKLLKNYPDLLDIERVIELTGYSRITFRTWCRKGELKPIMIQPKFLFPKQFVLELLTSEFYENISTKSYIYAKHLTNIYKEYSELHTNSTSKRRAKMKINFTYTDIGGIHYLNIHLPEHAAVNRRAVSSSLTEGEPFLCYKRETHKKTTRYCSLFALYSDNIQIIFQHIGCSLKC